jgi:ABC-type multidrug transport system fused ATPase/permease subunit
MRVTIMSSALLRMLPVALITLAYWKVENLYFANISSQTSLICSSLFIVFLIAVWAYSLFAKFQGVLGSNLASREEIEREIREELANKLSLLEHRVFELKGENHLLKTATGGRLARTTVPDQKLSILTQQRVFLHDLATKIQVLQGATDAAMALAQTLEHESREMLVKRLTMINRNLEEVAELHKANRDFIIMAA